MKSALAANPANSFDNLDPIAIRKMYEAGMMCIEIGKALGTTGTVISHFLSKRGIGQELANRDTRPDLTRADCIITYRAAMCAASGMRKIKRVTLPRVSMHVAALEARP